MPGLLHSEILPNLLLYNEATPNFLSPLPPIKAHPFTSVRGCFYLAVVKSETAYIFIIIIIIIF